MTGCWPGSRPRTGTTAARRDAAAARRRRRAAAAGTPSAGGMPGRVKCLHALAAHELACPGANALGREAVEAAGQLVGGRARAPGGRGR